MTQVKPVTPDTVEQLQASLKLNEATKIPGFVVDAFNTL
jgi:hypothetical protein